VGLSERTVTEILLCPECNGVGSFEERTLVDHHKGDYDYYDRLCTICKGQGRLQKKVTTITEVTPYDNPKVAEILFKKLKKKA